MNTKLKSDSDSEPDSKVESKSDAELMAKLNMILILNKSFC